MPEGPEIRRAADRIAKAVEGCVAGSVQFAREPLRPFESVLAGEEVAAVEPRGKALLVRFANGLSVYTHSQLYGRWFVRPAGELPATRRSLRFALHTPESSALLYSASEIDVLDDAAIESHPYLGRIGPDVLAADTDPGVVEERLASASFRGRRLGSLLLDQTFLAGLGNYLRSEILFEAGLPAETRPVDLDGARRRQLAEAVLILSRRAYRTGGVTNDPERVRALRARGVPRRRYRHHVFGRAGQPCYICGECVRRLEAGGRRLYACPGCQGPAREAG